MSGIVDLANKGRYGDDVLVHMNRGEVAGLAALAESRGRHLTINPETGYPEAFSLMDVLPTLVGIGASAMMPAASPWLIGGLTGAATAATTGSLERGLMSGITAGGLSALGGSLAAEGTQGLPATMDAQSAAFQNAGLTGADQALKTTGGAGFATDWAANNPSAAGALGIDQVGQPSPGLFGRFSDMGQGAKNLMNPPEGGKTMGQFLQANSKPAMAAGMGVMGSIALSDQEAQQERMKKERDEREGRKAADYQGSVNTIKQNYKDVGVPMPRINFAEGGMAMGEQNKVYQDMALNYMDMGLDVPSRLQQYLPQNNKASTTTVGSGSNWPSGSGWNIAGNYKNQNNSYTGLEGLQNRNQNYKPSAPPPRVQDSPQFQRGPTIQGADQVLQQAQLGQGGYGNAVMGADQVLQENQMAGGGYVGGPGDGMSDDIDTTIDGNQPAALSDGEFVISSDVVSHLGNGSTDAGAKMLYEMMDRIRQARTGTEDQGNKIDPYEYLPA